jgi:hypothetical protein
MRYIFLQQRSEDIITIEEYIKMNQPEIYMLLLRFRLNKRKIDVTDKVLVAADVAGIHKKYKYIMEERPKGGRGGLLSGEKEEELW